MLLPVAKGQFDPIGFNVGGLIKSSSLLLALGIEEMLNPGAGTNGEGEATGMGLRPLRGMMLKLD